MYLMTWMVLQHVGAKTANRKLRPRLPQDILPSSDDNEDEERYNL